MQLTGNQILGLLSARNGAVRSTERYVEVKMHASRDHSLLPLDWSCGRVHNRAGAAMQGSAGLGICRGEGRAGVTDVKQANIINPRPAGSPRCWRVGRR